MMPAIAQYRKAPQLTPTGLVATVDVSTERRPIPRPNITSKTCTIRAATTPARTELQLKVDLSKNTLRRVAIAIVASMAAALVYVSTPRLRAARSNRLDGLRSRPVTELVSSRGSDSECPKRRRGTARNLSANIRALNCAKG